MLDANPSAATTSHSFLSELSSGERFVGRPGMGWEGKRVLSPATLQNNTVLDTASARQADADSTANNLPH